MTSISFKFGTVSFDWETQAELALSDIHELFDRIESLASAAPRSPVISLEPSTTGGTLPDAVTGLHINSIASTTNASSGPDLAIAAAARLQIVEKKASFSRQELLVAMKDATKFYKASMSGNLTKILAGLVGGKLNQVGQNQYSLSASEFTKLEAMLAQSS